MRTSDFSKAPAVARGTAMFVGATRYRGMRSIATLSLTWYRLVADMKRMEGYCWHKIYWEFPFTLGTIAFFTDRDAMLAFARSKHHRKLMCWVADHGTKNATGGYIRLYNAEPEGYSNGVWRAEENVLAHIEHFTPTGSEIERGLDGPPVHRPSRPPARS